MDTSYKVIYSDRKSFGLSVERDKSIILRAPKKAKTQDIDDFVERKKFWLYKKLHHPQKYRQLKRKEFISGASILYLGRNYRLNIVNNGIDDIQFNNVFVISKTNQTNAYDLFRNWYLQKAKDKIIQKALYHSKNIGVDFQSIKVSDLKYRWGSCTPKNNLNFNWRLIKAPLHVIEYVIVHELAHLKESNHTQRFWSIIKTQIPRYNEAKTWLKENGHLLEVDF